MDAISLKVERREAGRRQRAKALRREAQIPGIFYGPGTWFERNESVAIQVGQQAWPIVGDGGGVWSFIHVEDAAEATAAAIELGNPGAYNIVDNNPSEVRVWLPAYANWLNAPPPIQIDAGQVDDPDFLYYFTRLRGASNTKARNELGFQPRPLEWLQA